MSIASEIEDLNTNLTAAKNAVTAKGGTVGDTGLAGLAAEIASIPSGGGITDYGTIKYVENGVNKTVTMDSEVDFIELSFGGSGSILNINGTEINKNWIREVTVSNGVQYLPDNFMLGCNYATTVTLPSSIHYIGDGVFQSCTDLNSPLDLSSVTFIGNSFLHSCSSFNQPISLPKVDKIAYSFMVNCVAFNSSITLNNDLRVIEQNFMEGCTSFAQPFTIPAGLETTSSFSNNPGQRFMYNCNNFVGPLVCNAPSVSSKIPTNNYVLSTTNSSAPMYTTGVTLSGTYAQDWKTAIPDRTSSPYRKLIVGS